MMALILVEINEVFVNSRNSYCRRALEVKQERDCVIFFIDSIISELEEVNKFRVHSEGYFISDVVKHKC